MNGISIIICTHNGVGRLEPTLNAILALASPADVKWELLIIDNASNDGTASFCQSFLEARSKGLSWYIVSEPRPGVGYARLRGLREATYDWILYCDDDNALAENYILVGIEILFRNIKIGALGGCGIPVFEGEKPEWFERYSHSYAVGAQAYEDGRLQNFPAELYSAGMWIRRAPLLSFFDRGFVPILTGRKGVSLASGEDVEWCYLLQLAGYEIWYSHRLTFTHTMSASRMQWSYYLRLKKGIASGAAHLMPYASLLRQREMGLISFALKLITRTLLTTAMLFKHKLKLYMKSGVVRPEDELALVILWSKTTSYWLNAGKALKHFRQIKEIL